MTRRDAACDNASEGEVDEESDGFSYHDETVMPGLKDDGTLAGGHLFKDAIDKAERLLIDQLDRECTIPKSIDLVGHGTFEVNVDACDMAAGHIVGTVTVQPAPYYEATITIERKEKCPNCAGTGHESVPRHPGSFWEPPDYATCGFCGGSGSVK
jgi:hypothetical protein